MSLRENVATDSLHVVVDDNRVTAHVDGVSPLAVLSHGPSRYSLRRAVAHNLAGMGQDLVWLLRGRQGDHRCELNCEWVPDRTQSTPEGTRLLDPAAQSWSVHLEARVTGRLDDARLRAALGVVLGRHAPGRDLLEVVDCRDDESLAGARARLQSMVVGIADCPPLHVCLARHPAGDAVMLNLNHAAADGVGALRVLRSIARAYAGDSDPGVPLDFVADVIGNFSVTARVSTSRRERAGAVSALAAVTAQTARNKRTRTGIALIAALERGGLLALWAKQSIVVLQPLTGNHLVDASMLCSLGSLDEAPCFGTDAGETRELWFSTPARSPVSLCIGAVTVGGRLHLTFRHPHRLFGSDPARRFAETYLDHLRQVADSRA